MLRIVLRGMLKTAIGNKEESFVMTLDQFEPGLRVYIKVNVSGTKLYGMVARGYSKWTIDWMVKFDDDRLVTVNQTNAMFFHPDIRN